MRHEFEGIAFWDWYDPDRKTPLADRAEYALRFGQARRGLRPGLVLCHPGDEPGLRDWAASHGIDLQPRPWVQPNVIRFANEGGR